MIFTQHNELTAFHEHWQEVLNETMGLSARYSSMGITDDELIKASFNKLVGIHAFLKNHHAKLSIYDEKFA